MRNNLFLALAFFLFGDSQERPILTPLRNRAAPPKEEYFAKKTSHDLKKKKKPLGCMALFFVSVAFSIAQDVLEYRTRHWISCFSLSLFLFPAPKNTHPPAPKLLLLLFFRKNGNKKKNEQSCVCGGGRGSRRGRGGRMTQKVNVFLFYFMYFHGLYWLCIVHYFFYFCFFLIYEVSISAFVCSSFFVAVHRYRCYRHHHFRRNTPNVPDYSWLRLMPPELLVMINDVRYIYMQNVLHDPIFIAFFVCFSNTP